MKRVQVQYPNGDPMPIPDAAAVSREVITSSATSQQSTVTGIVRGMWRVSANGGDVLLQFGDDPTVSASNFDDVVLDGTTVDFGARSGQLVAVIDA